MMFDDFVMRETCEEYYNDDDLQAVEYFMTCEESCLKDEDDYSIGINPACRTCPYFRECYEYLTGEEFIDE